MVKCAGKPKLANDGVLRRRTNLKPHLPCTECSLWDYIPTVQGKRGDK
jgi:hypothetical protein